MPRVHDQDMANITLLVLKQYGFLPQPIMCQVVGDEVEITYPEESEANLMEAERLSERAGKHATTGNYERAIGILKRVLELAPSMHRARRDLAMAYVEIGDVDNATNHLIEVLRLEPGDAWSWVVLANLYIQKKSDKETGEKFLRKALEIAPNDAWALNSLAALTQEKGNDAEAISLFEKAIASNSKFANAYYGEAIVYYNSKQPEEAVSVLERMFTNAEMQDVRSKPVYDGARRVFGLLQANLAERNQSEVFKLVQNFKAQNEKLSGYPVRIQEEEFESKIGATIQMAWKHKRDFHLLKIRASYPPPLVNHLECHELSYLKMESEARKAGKNLFFTTTAATRETSIRAVGNDIRRWEKAGFSEQKIAEVTQTLTRGLCEFLFNCPLDMLIERDLRKSFALLRPSQFLSVHKMATEAAETNRNPEIRKLTPRRLMNGSLALNGAYALFLDDLFKGATEFTNAYRSEETFAMSQKLWKHWQEKSNNLSPGAEYGLVDEFADMVGLRGWYEWKTDPGHHLATAAPLKEGTTNPELLREKHPAAVFFFLDAFKRFDALEPSKCAEITMEIAMLGRNGLDYSTPEKKYELRSIPGEKFSGLHLMCLMHAGLKRLDPTQNTGMDLDDPFLTALQMHQAGGTGDGNK